MIANLNIKKTTNYCLYMHIDGQAVDPSKWNQEDPYKAVVKEKLPMDLKLCHGII